MEASKTSLLSFPFKRESNMDLIELWTICSSNGIILDKNQMAQLSRFHDELRFWNAKVNLISRKDEQNIIERHILHSLSVLKYIQIPQKAKCLDIGTGGGLPGIPLKIARQDLFMLLVDSIAKKLKITRMLANHTGLRNISVKRCRAEELASDKIYLNHFDFVFSRAVGKISQILDWTNKITKKGSCFVFYKGGDLTQEVNEAKQIFPDFVFTIHGISLLGAEWFAREEKMLVVCNRF